jgi:hypothetical protein
MVLSSGYAVASDRAGFQQFDNQYNIGYGYNQVTVQNGSTNQAQVDSQALSLEVERLFDVGVWMDVVANMNIQSSTNQAVGLGGKGASGGQPALTQNPNFVSGNAKVGYSFEVACNYLQIIPYLTIGRNSNLMQSTVSNNGGANQAQDYFIAAGVGGRLEYRINRAIDIYVDQLMSYNWDQSNPTAGGVQPQNFIFWTSTVGAKFNIVKNLQLGINGFYTNYQLQSNSPVDTLASGGATIYQPSYALGGMIDVGLTY